ncbi:helix-turn-helix transcriptional regulator [Bradyrhizobium genosp. L]|uniref:helix-turn-helix transcriptional regulator n=1 Tax=Bradyrhizobium genosp. L TaxID=83637 RepID=UPI0018A3057D|nr:AraC family transcriptional regulator [Bradyrhizobium genosp. L]QPF82051.1 helix-turn-helix transcriptional regulator [Bradyrhizobium genosp. L]
MPEINFINGPSVQSVRTGGLIARCFRTTCLEPKPDVFLGFCAEDTYMVRLFLKAHPANTLVRGRRRIDLPPRGSMESAIRHVCEPFSWKMSHAVDVINFEIPTMTIHDYLPSRRSRSVAQLKVDENSSLTDPTIASFGLATLQVIDAEKDFTQFFVDHIVDGLCKHVALQYFGADDLEARRGGLAPWQERRAKDLMHSAIGRTLSLQEVADLCGLSVGHFSKAFKKSTGCSPHKWLMEQRIEMALSLLSDDTLSLTDIAARCGFVDQSHLTKTCNRRVGVPPGVYRRRAASALAG